MAVYFDHRIATPGIEGSPSEIAWHCIHPLLAVASISTSSTPGGSVDVYLEQGEHIPNAHVERPFQPGLLSWHPSKRILTVGWQTGVVTFWSDHGWDEHQVTGGTHRTEITILEWSSNGARLISADKAGVLIVWRVDHHGQVQGPPLGKHDYGKHLVHCIFKPPAPGEDLVQLAKAAVSGDENALDMFNWRKAGKGDTPFKVGLQEGIVCFVTTIDGTVYCVGDKGKSLQVLCTDGPIRKLMYMEEKEILMIVTEALFLSQHRIGPDGSSQELMKVKLSGKTGQAAEFIWAERDLLITASGEAVVRLWDLDRNENYALTPDKHLGYSTGESINCISYCENKGILAAGTSKGQVAMWRRALVSGTGGRRLQGKNQWKLQAPIDLEGNIIQLKWGSSKNLLSVNTAGTVLILSEQVMSAHFNQQVAAIQVAPNQLSLVFFSSGNQLMLQTDIHVKGVYVTKEVVVVWNGKHISVFELFGPSLRNAGSFPCDCCIVAVHEESIYTVEPNRVQVRTLQGTVKQLLVFSETEGNPCHLQICGNFLAVGTDKAHVKVFDLSRREAKPHSNSKNLAEYIPDLGSITSLKCSSNGNNVSILIKKVNGSPDSRVFFYDVEMDTINYFDFEIGKPSSENCSMPHLEESNMEKARSEMHELMGRYPISHFWDQNEPKLFVCEASLAASRKRPSNIAASVETNSTEYKVDVMVISFFSTQEHGLLLQDSFPKMESHEALLGLEVPYYYFSKKSGQTENDPESMPGSPSVPQMVARRPLKDFVGLEDCDKTTRDAMLNFSFYLTIGDMDEAFKSIKLIKSESVWENMARMCVKTRRLDVAKVCLGNMGHARGARALREAALEPELDARVAMLAVQLGMLEDAERLYRNCKRFDLLTKFYQASGQWQKAIENAEAFDRVHLRTTYYNYAKHLEAVGDQHLALSL